MKRIDDLMLGHKWLVIKIKPYLLTIRPFSIKLYKMTNARYHLLGGF